LCQQGAVTLLKADNIEIARIFLETEFFIGQRHTRADKNA
jgi:hypothetical protein